MLIATVALLQMLLRAEIPLGQDTLWGARWGMQVLRSGDLPWTDTYSWTARGKPFIPNSWGWNVVLGADYGALGVIGFWLIGAVMSLTLALTTARAAQRLGAPPLVTIAVYAPLGLLGLEAVPRAQTLSNIAILLIPPLLAPLLFGHRRTSTRSLVLLCMLQIVWMNLHSLALMGPVIVTVSGVGLIVARRAEGLPTPVLRLASGTVATALCCLITPYGIEPITHAEEVRRASVGLVTEWEHVGFGSVAQALGLLAVAAAALPVRRAWRLGRPDTAACIALLAVCTGFAIRFLPMLAIFAAAEIALYLAGLRIRPQIFRRGVGLMVAVLSLLATVNLRDLGSLGELVSPRLVGELPAGCRLLNDDLVGDAVILLRPDVAVSIDGRYDMYGRQIIIRVENMFANRPGTDGLLDADRINCVLGPTSSQLVQALRLDRHWTVVGTDTVRTLLVRAPGASE